MSLTVEEMKEKLREWREDNSRHSDDIVEFWDDGLDIDIEQLGDERQVPFCQPCLKSSYYFYSLHFC